MAQDLNENQLNKTCRVLIIDDDESILDAISLLLSEFGFVCETLANGELVMQKVQEFAPDVILLDVLISGTDGRHICQSLKNNPETLSIPIIMISAHPSAEKELAKYGADVFLSKPFETNDLIKKIEQFC